MGFSSYLKNNVVDEWSYFYLNFAKLKKLSKSKKNTTPYDTSTFSNLNINYLLKNLKKKHLCKNFFFKKTLIKEIDKVNYFYILLEKSSFDEIKTIFSEIESFVPKNKLSDFLAEKKKIGHLEDMLFLEYNKVYSKENPVKKNKDETLRARNKNLFFSLEMRKREKHVTEFLSSLVKIKRFKEMNITSALKILGRYKAQQREDTDFERTFFKKVLSRAYFYRSTNIQKIKETLKKIYRKIFSKDSKEALKVFKRIRKGIKSSDLVFMLFGLVTGLNVGFVYSWVHRGRSDLEPFLALNLIFLAFILFGFCLKAFKNYKINYKFIFSFHACSTLNNARYFLTVGLLQFLSNILQITGALAPVNVLLLNLLFLFNPFNCFFYNSRLYFLMVFARAVFLPLSTIRFRHFYFVDVAQSFSFSYKIFFKNFVATKIFLALIINTFSLLRILQCLKRFVNSKLVFPHIFNCGKYFLSLLFGLGRIYAHENSVFVILLGTVSSVVNIVWDVFVDWMLFRNIYMFPKVLYAFVLLFDVFMRFSWVLVLWNKEKGLEYFLVFSEVIRRFLWTLIRVETEHLNNCDELKMQRMVKLTSDELFYRKDDHQESSTDGVITDIEFSATEGCLTETEQ